MSNAGPGTPIPGFVRGQLEQYFGQDLSHMRMHRSDVAGQFGGDAATSGKRVFWPSSGVPITHDTGRKLLAHEITHSLQQSSGAARPGLNPDASLEQAADNAGAEALNPSAATPEIAAGPHLSAAPTLQCGTVRAYNLRRRTKRSGPVTRSKAGVQKNANKHIRIRWNQLTPAQKRQVTRASRQQQAHLEGILGLGISMHRDDYKKHFHHFYRPARGLASPYKTALDAANLSHSKASIKTGTRVRQKGVTSPGGVTQGLAPRYNPNRRRGWSAAMRRSAKGFEALYGKGENLHIVAHSQGGDESDLNATPGTKDANTEDIAFESAVRHYWKDGPSMGIHGVRMKHTHYRDGNGHLHTARHKLYIPDGHGGYRKIIDWAVNGKRGRIGMDEFEQLAGLFNTAHLRPVTNIDRDEMKTAIGTSKAGMV